MFEDLSEINISSDIQIMFGRYHLYVYQQLWACVEYVAFKYMLNLILTFTISLDVSDDGEYAETCNDYVAS
jgi:hypothetical protein